MKNKIKRIFLVGSVTYILIEITCFIFIKTGYIGANLPQFFTDPRDTMVFPYTYADVNEQWGVWHYNYPVKARYGCVTLTCDPNSTGARDVERTLHSTDTNRCIVLGDSFMEGFGIADKDRVSNLLEAATGHEFMNFACSDMGSTQEYLVYKHLASKYDHNTILLGILPANDFMNDNIQFDSSQSPLRYKPYWKGAYPNMSIYYYTDHLNKSEFSYNAYLHYKTTFKYKLRHVLENTTCWFNILYFVMKKKGAVNVIAKHAQGHKTYSGYFDYSPIELDRLKQSLLSLRNAAPGKRIIAFTIPIASDWRRYGNSKTFPSLVTELEKFCKTQNIIYTDLLTTGNPDDQKNYKQQFFDCGDIHWNEHGNQWAMKKLLSYLTEKK
ncbi:hypothetical protein [Niastella sp. OAS944]|uniref:hypothetical protein n=1 Tax=Niastella sp. OAS944 TaxID=2664089 RepID=UPI003499B2F3|nr:hypothetical protein [Chitinophagaceae bacterium OAS944]